MPIRRQMFADPVLCGHIPAHTRGAPVPTATSTIAAAASCGTTTPIVDLADPGSRWPRG